MDSKKRWTLIAVLSVAVALCAVTFVTATPHTSTTPLYTYRMEQVSSKMHFLPTPTNNFTYSAEQGCTLNTVIYRGHYYSGEPGETETPTCPETCDTCDQPTCPVTCETCPLTCPETCRETCKTCDQPTCPLTCNPTCNDLPTCKYSTCKTCLADTCLYSTCENTCVINTCNPTCNAPETCVGGRCESP